MENFYEVHPIGIKYICDICCKGDMLPTGRNEWSASPPAFEHVCNKCGQKANFTEKYSLIRFINI